MLCSLSVLDAVFNKKMCRISCAGYSSKVLHISFVLILFTLRRLEEKDISLMVSTQLEHMARDVFSIMDSDIVFDYNILHSNLF